MTNSQYNPETAAENSMILAIGKDWRARVVTFLSAELTPFLAAELGEAFDISGQSSAACCKALETLDLVTCYAKKIQKAGHLDRISGGVARPYYLLGPLAETDRDEFILYPKEERKSKES
jgi:hypothetical protein